MKKYLRISWKNVEGHICQEDISFDCILSLYQGLNGCILTERAKREIIEKEVRYVMCHGFQTKDYFLNVVRPIQIIEVEY